MLHDLALIATVGLGIVDRPSVAGRLFSALQEESVNVRMINQGASQINLLIGVVKEDFERSARAIDGAFGGG